MRSDREIQKGLQDVLRGFDFPPQPSIHRRFDDVAEPKASVPFEHPEATITLFHRKA